MNFFSSLWTKASSSQDASDKFQASESPSGTIPSNLIQRWKSWRSYRLRNGPLEKTELPSRDTFYEKTVTYSEYTVDPHIWNQVLKANYFSTAILSCSLQFKQGHP